MVPQLKLLTLGSYKLRGDNDIYTIDCILLMPPSFMKLDQISQRPFPLLKYTRSSPMKVKLETNSSYVSENAVFSTCRCQLIIS